MLRSALSGLKRTILGNTDFPAQCIVGTSDPQSEVSVSLHGADLMRDVTDSHMMACPSPFTIGIGMEGGVSLTGRLSLRFLERGDHRLLGEIGLALSEAIRTDGPLLHLFDVRQCRNYCLPGHRLWAHYLHKAYLRRRDGNKSSDVPMTARGTHAMMAFFICPRPVALVSVGRGDAGNIFPMNLMGEIGGGYFAFALNSSRRAAPLVENAGRLAITGIPIERSSFARQFGRNHWQEFVPWSEFPFATKLSPTFGLPVPGFALRVRELKVEVVRRLGSHTLFVARVVHDEQCSDGLQFSMIHGIYQAWRDKHRPQVSSAVSS